VPLVGFQRQLQQLQYQAERSPTGSLLSRLPLFHQVAKAYVVEACYRSGASTAAIEIDELTDPPLYDLGIEDSVVIIHYRYVKSGQP